MNREKNKTLKFLHVSIEAITPLSIGSGRLNGTEDSPITLDCYGLPTIPATGIAGVIRSLYEASGDAVLSTDELFGYASRKIGDQSQSLASPIEISNGVIHNSDDQPMMQPDFNEKGGLQDKALDKMRRSYIDAAPMRKRVRISDRGVADAQKGGLFDRSIVPRGTRFTFEICLSCNKNHDQRINATWGRIKQILKSHYFRLGGATRSGLGAVKCVAMREWTFDLDNETDFENYISTVEKLQRLQLPLDPLPAEAESGLRNRIQLRPVDYWRIGNLSRPLPGKVDADSEPDLAPYSEQSWNWKGRTATVEENILIPATSIKGALRHRTAFHFNRLRNNFIDLSDPNYSLPDTDENPAVLSLFGSVKSKNGGRRGRLLINDAFIPLSSDPKLQTIMHNSIDRFTGSVRNGALFSEQMIWKNSFLFEWDIIKGDTEIDDLADKAFYMAVEDLKTQRLALGAGAGRGHGQMEAIYA